jgi:hypothetical protein
VARQAEEYVKFVVLGELHICSARLNMSWCVIAMMLALAWDDRCSSTKLKLRPCPASSQSTTFIFSWTSYFSSLSWNCIRLQPISQQVASKSRNMLPPVKIPIPSGTNAFYLTALSLSSLPSTASVSWTDGSAIFGADFVWAKRDMFSVTEFSDRPSLPLPHFHQRYR